MLTKSFHISFQKFAFYCAMVIAVFAYSCDTKQTAVEGSVQIKVSDSANIADTNCKKQCDNGLEPVSCKEWRERSGRRCN